MINKNVAVIGASDKEDRYSNKAVKLLTEKGYTVFPVHQRIKLIDGLTVYRDISDIEEKLDTISLYVNADVSSQMTDDILKAAPRRVIFNPGAENDALEKALQAAGIETLRACTLVLLNTGEF